MADKKDAGKVERYSDNTTRADGSWSTNVTYSDELGNRLSVDRGSQERGSSQGAYNSISSRCANGGVVPEHQLQKLNQDLRAGFWLPDALPSVFGQLRDHDFGDTNPLKNACAVAPKPRTR